MLQTADKSVSRRSLPLNICNEMVDSMVEENAPNDITSPHRNACGNDNSQQLVGTAFLSLKQRELRVDSSAQGTTSAICDSSFNRLSGHAAGVVIRLQSLAPVVHLFPISDIRPYCQTAEQD